MTAGSNGYSTALQRVGAFLRDLPGRPSLVSLRRVHNDIYNKGLPVEIRRDALDVAKSYAGVVKELDMLGVVDIMGQSVLYLTNLLAKITASLGFTPEKMSEAPGAIAQLIQDATFYQSEARQSGEQASALRDEVGRLSQQFYDAKGSFAKIMSELGFDPDKDSTYTAILKIQGDRERASARSRILEDLVELIIGERDEGMGAAAFGKIKMVLEHIVDIYNVFGIAWDLDKIEAVVQRVKDLAQKFTENERSLQQITQERNRLKGETAEIRRNNLKLQKAADRARSKQNLNKAIQEIMKKLSDIAGELGIDLRGKSIKGAIVEITESVKRANQAKIDMTGLAARYEELLFQIMENLGKFRVIEDLENLPQWVAELKLREQESEEVKEGLIKENSTLRGDIEQLNLQVDRLKNQVEQLQNEIERAQAALKYEREVNAQINRQLSVIPSSVRTKYLWGAIPGFTRVLPPVKGDQTAYELAIESSALVTNVGTVREHNEDAVIYLKMPEKGIEVYAVGDGMGGHGGGDVASRRGLEIFSESINNGLSMEQAAFEAAKAVIEKGKEIGNPNMGTTLVALQIDHKAKMARIIKIGDSRVKAVTGEFAYNFGKDHKQLIDLLEQVRKIKLPLLLSDEEIGRIETDSDEIYEQYKGTPYYPINNPNIITSCLGRTDGLQILSFEIPIVEASEPTIFLLYSDGTVDGEMDEARITKEARESINMARAQGAAVNGAGLANIIVQGALDGESKDNVTVAAVVLPYRLALDGIKSASYSANREFDALVRNEEEESDRPPKARNESVISFKRSGIKRDIKEVRFVYFAEDRLEKGAMDKLLHVISRCVSWFSTKLNIHIASNLDVFALAEPELLEKLSDKLNSILLRNQLRISIKENIYIYLTGQPTNPEIGVIFDDLPADMKDFF